MPEAEARTKERFVLPPPKPGPGPRGGNWCNAANRFNSPVLWRASSALALAIRTFAPNGSHHAIEHALDYRTTARTAVQWVRGDHLPPRWAVELLAAKLRAVLADLDRTETALPPRGSATIGLQSRAGTLRRQAEKASMLDKELAKRDIL